MLALEEMLQGLDHGGVRGVFEAHAIGEHVADVRIRDENLPEGSYALIGGEKALPVRPTPFAAQDEADSAAQDPIAPTRARASA